MSAVDTLRGPDQTFRRTRGFIAADGSPIWIPLAATARTSRNMAAKKVDPDRGSSDTGARPSFGLVLVRIAAGAILLHLGLRAGHAGVSADLVTQTSGNWAETPEYVRQFGETVVLQRPELSAHFAVWSAIVLGAALFLGFLTRPAGILAAILCTCAAFAAADTDRWAAGLLAVCAILLVIAALPSVTKRRNAIFKEED